MDIIAKARVSAHDCDDDHDWDKQCVADLLFKFTCFR